ERIRMFIFHGLEQQAAGFEIIYDERIGCFYEHALPWLHRFDEFSLFVDKLYERQIILPAYLCVVFSECRRGMDDTGTVVKRYEIVMHHIICLFVRRHEIEQRLILHSEKLRTL